MMASAENLSLYSSLLGEDLSIWSFDDHAKQLGDGASLDTSIQFMDSMVSPKRDSTDIMEGDQSDPLPEWMSEKIDVNGWLDDLIDRPITHELQMNKMLQADDLIGPYDVAIPDYVKCLDDEQMLPLSPDNSIGSCGTAANSSLSSPGPSSPYSLAETNSSGFDSGFDSFRETEDTMMADVESLINSCKDADTFLQLADSITLQLPIHGEDMISPLLEGVTLMQADLQCKIKTEPPAGPGSPKAVGGGKLKVKVVTKERRERKKGQNKDAATRYRHKKKKETNNLSSDLGSLEKTNGDLKDKVGSLEKEISYLKELLQEIYKVKGQIKILKSP